MRRGIEIHGTCPYCEYVYAVRITDIRGEHRVERWLDCKELFVVEAAVPSVELRAHRIVGVDGDAVLDRLVRKALDAAAEPESASTSPPAAAPPPAPPAEPTLQPSPADPAPPTPARASPPPPTSPPETARGHMHNPYCWCRKKPSSTRNPWCRLTPDGSKPSAALRTPAPRADRYKVRRVPGTYGGQ